MAIPESVFVKPYFSQSFDYFNQLEKPSITLCNPDRTQLYSLQACYDTEVKLKWNSQSEFNFSFPRFIDNVALEAFDYIEGKRLVLIENIGYFIIVNVQDDFDGSVPIKTVSCYSQDSELVYKRISLFTGTYSLSELMEIIFGIAPGWGLNYVDSSLSGIYRTFNVSDTNVYQFLTKDVSIAFNCIFVFDYTTKVIYIISENQEPDDTDVFLSFSNLLEKTEYHEITEEITTCLYCYGGGNLTVASVNPLGTNAIYDFTYYKDTDWMSQGLINAINAWEDKVDSYTSQYTTLLSNLSDYQNTLLEQQADLADLETELASLRNVRAARIQQGLDTTEVDAQISEYEDAIRDQNILITATVNLIASVTSDLSDITDALDLQNTDNFTSIQYLELSNFIFENTYRNDNIIITDSMTFSEIQDQAQQLYDIALEVLSKTAIPRYQVTITAANFLALSEYIPFIGQMTLGDQITVDTERGYFIDAVLLEYDFSYDNPEEFNLILSNQQRIDDSHFAFTDLIAYSYQQGNTLGFNSANWNDWTNSKDLVLGNVNTPSGILAYGIKSSNLKGTIDAGQSLAITNTNQITGGSNIKIDHSGVTLQDATLYSGSNLGTDGEIITAGGGVLYFRGGIFVSGSGLGGSGVLYDLEDLTGQTGSSLALSGSFVEDSVNVYINGLFQRTDFSFSEGPGTSTVTMLDQVLDGDTVTVEYIPILTT